MRPPQPRKVTAAARATAQPPTPPTADPTLLNQLVLELSQCNSSLCGLTTRLITIADRTISTQGAESGDKGNAPSPYTSVDKLREERYVYDQLLLALEATVVRLEAL